MQGSLLYPAECFMTKPPRGAQLPANAILSTITETAAELSEHVPDSERVSSVDSWRIPPEGASSLPDDSLGQRANTKLAAKGFSWLLV